MDADTVWASLLVAGVAGGAVNMVHRLVIDRHLAKHKSDLQAERDAALARYKSDIDEEVQKRLLERRGAIDAEVQSTVERLRAEIARDVHTHESNLKLAADLELRIFDRDLQHVGECHAAVSDASYAVRAVLTAMMATSASDLESAMPGHFASLGTKIARAWTASLSVPDEYREAIVLCVGRLEGVVFSLAQAMHEMQIAAAAYAREEDPAKQEAMLKRRQAALHVPRGDAAPVTSR